MHLVDISCLPPSPATVDSTTVDYRREMIEFLRETANF